MNESTKTAIQRALFQLQDALATSDEPAGLMLDVAADGSDQVVVGIVADGELLEYGLVLPSNRCMFSADLLEKFNGAVNVHRMNIIEERPLDLR